MLEEDYEFACPYCGARQYIRLDVSGGANQRFVSDCEVCCRPISIVAMFDGDELINFSAETDES